MPNFYSMTCWDSDTNASWEGRFPTSTALTYGYPESSKNIVVTIKHSYDNPVTHTRPSYPTASWTQYKHGTITGAWTNVQFEFNHPWEACDSTTESYYTLSHQKLTPQQRFAQMLKERRAPTIITNTKPVGHTVDEREMRARETLKRIIGPEKYENFLRAGWVNVKGKSGKSYQIFPGHGFTKVYDKGKQVERLCIVLPSSFPPTDSIIIRYLLILNNEKLFWSKAVKHGVGSDRRNVIADHRTIMDIAREYRAVG